MVPTFVDVFGLVWCVVFVLSVFVCFCVLDSETCICSQVQGLGFHVVQL